jgi:peptidoglycan/LPS O-acetylase OafA/YrhL
MTLPPGDPTTLPADGTEKRLHYLDGLRGLAALGVALCHFVVFYDQGFQTGRREDSHLGWEKWVANTPLNLPINGGLMVEIFFVLSGYVLTNAFLNNRTFLGSLVRRYVRLALPVLAACLFAWLLNLARLNFTHAMYLTWHGAWDLQPFRPLLGDLLQQALYRVFFLPFDPSSGLIVALWTIPIEFSGSILIMIFAVSLRSRRVNPLGVLFLLTVASWGYHQFFMLAGVWIYLLREKGFVLPSSRPVLWIGLSFLALVYGTYPGLPKPGWLYRALTCDPATFFDLHGQKFLCFIEYSRSALSTGTAACILLVMVISSTRMQAFLRRFTFLGKISFPLYLIHIPVLSSVGGGTYLLMAGISRNVGVACLVSFLAYAVVVITLAWILYHLVERPAVRFSKKVGLWVDDFCEPSSPALVRS